MMPSLLRYFAIVGGILFAGLIGLNALLEPGGPGPTLVKAEARKPVIQVDPRASKVERLRAEEAAQKAVASAAPVAEPIPQPAPVVAAVQPAEPAQTIAPVALTTSPDEAEAERAVRVAQEKMKAEKARKQRIARERARARALEEASAQQVPQYHYGYAPRPTYGPFGQGGGGGGGWGQRW
jgi:hypothetical protein